MGRYVAVRPNGTILSRGDVLRRNGGKSVAFESIRSHNTIRTFYYNPINRAHVVQETNNASVYGVRIWDREARKYL